GIGHGNALETTVARLAATNSGSGNIQMVETDGIQLSAVQQTSAIATGNIEVVSNTGLLDVLAGGAGIGAFGTGSISLQADGAAAGNLSVNALVQTTSGAITLRADNNVTFTANGDVTSTTGNVVVNADDDNSGAAGGLLTMADGVLINAGSGTITLTSDGNLTLGGLQTTNATANAVQVTSREGGIVDGGDSDIDIIANAAGSVVTLTAALGIGSAGLGDIDTRIDSLDASVTAAGSLFLKESDSITLADVDTVNGAIMITAGGQITAADVQSITDGDANDISLTATAGDIRIGLINAGATSGDVTLSTSGSVFQAPVDAAVDITADDLTIIAVNVGATTSSVFAALPDGIEVSVIDLSINATGTAAFSGSVTGTTTIAPGLQTLFIMSNEHVAFSDLAPSYITNLALIADRDNNGSGSVQLNSSLTVSGDLRIEGADVTTSPVDGEIYLTADRILFSTRTSETLRLTLTEPTAGQAGSFEGHSQNDLTVFSSTAITLEDLTPGIAPVTTAAAVTAANISVTAINSTLTINGAVTSTGSGNLGITGGTGVTHTASGDLTTTTTGTITVAATTGNVTMADGTLYSTGSGAVSVTAGSSVAIGQISTVSSAVTITATAGSISDATALETVANISTSGTATLTAALGIGSTGVGNINTSIGTLDAAVTDAGSLFLEEADTITLLDVDTANGGITIVAGGTITATDVASTTEADENDISLTSTAGDIRVALINAGTTAGDVTLSAAGAIIEAGSDSDADITADTLILIATSGIGVTADPIETQINTLFAENSGSGNIEIVEVAGSDLTLLSVRQTNSAGNGSINIATTNGQLRLAATGFGVHSAGAGNIQLAAGGASSDLSVFSNISGNFGNVTLQAGRDILLGEGSTLAGGSGLRGVAISAAGPATVLAAGGAAAGTTVLSVRSAGGFVAGEEVQLVDGLLSERAVIASVDLTARTITLTGPLLGNYSSVAQVLNRRVAATLTADVPVATAVLPVTNTELFAPGTRVDIEVGGTIQTGVVASVDAGVGTISLTQPLTFDAATGTRIFAARDQAISLSADRNLLAADGTLLTTDNLRSGSYSDLRGDRISVVVDANNNAFREDRNGDTNLTIADYIGAGGIQDGVLLLGADSRLRTDGGVASGFANRPLISETLFATNTAFFNDFPDPTIAAIGAVDAQLRYSVTFSLVIPSPGEENVRVDIDWRDPSVGPSDARIDSQYLNFVDGASSSLVRHRYHLNDFVNFFIIKKNPLLLDFAVSHHETVSLTADAGIQGSRSALPWVNGSGTAEVSLAGNLSTTDNRGTTVPGPFPIEPAGVNRTVAWVADDTLSQADYLFEGGIIRLNLPAPPFMREEEATPFVSGEMEPVPMREVFFRQFTQPENRLDEDLPLEQPSSVSEDIYQLRKRGDSGEYQVEKEDIKSGERLLHPQLLRKWVTDENVSSGTGYELWLITRKKTASGGEIVVERQLLQFDVRDQRPFPSAEDAESLAPAELRLVPAEPAAQPGANPPAANGAALDQPAAAGAPAEPLNAASATDSHADESADAEESRQPAPVATSAIAGIVVSQALRSRVAQAAGTAGAAALKVTRSLRNHRRF
ncbi:MAG: Hemolysin, partial [Planctomycetota bacterium]